MASGITRTLNKTPTKRVVLGVTRDGRRCEVCSKPLIRTPAESMEAFKLRDYCSVACRTTRESNKKAANAKRICLNCGDLLNRLPDEDKAVYGRRRYCDLECEAQAYRHVNEATQVADKYKERIKDLKEKARLARKDPDAVPISDTLDTPMEAAMTPIDDQAPEDCGLMAPLAMRALAPLTNTKVSIQKLARAYTIDAVNALVGVVRTGSDRDKIPAARELLDRGWGKSQSTHNLNVRRIEDMDENEIARILGYDNADVIEGEVLDNMLEQHDMADAGES